MKTLSEMVREAGLPEAWISKNGVLSWKQLQRFSKLVRADERAKLAEQPAQQGPERLLQEIARLHDRIKDLESDVEFLSQPAPVQQEPIGYAIPTFDFDNSVIKKVHYAGTVPLYTTPPAQRTWVGLTEGDLDELACGGLFTNRQNLARAVEAKLRSKNT